MTGLNDSFFLADDGLEPKKAPAVTLDVFKDNPENPEVPELNDDVDLIAVAVEDMQIALRDLDLLQTNIKDQGGMNRHLALEAHSLIPGFLHDDRPAEYFTKMPSRTLLSSALEDINNEKKSVIKRMINKIVEFIAKIVKRIKDYFIVDPEVAKANQQFAKNYKGPSDEQLKQTADAINQQQATKTQAATPGNKPADKNNPSSGLHMPKSMQEDADNASKAAGEKIDIKQARSFFNGEKMALISAMLGPERLSVVAAMMEPGFETNYLKAIELVNDWTVHKLTTNIDIIDKRVRELTELVNTCNQVIAEFANDGEESNRKVLGKWVMGKDHAAIDRVNGYFDGHPMLTLVAATSIKFHIESLNKFIAEVNKADPDNAVENLKHVQKETTSLASMVTLLAKVDNCYFTVIKGLRKPSKPQPQK